MLKIGLDFGTTNSTLSYQNGTSVESHKFGGAGGANYVPSCLAFEKEDLTVSFGWEAKQRQQERTHEVFNNFKMLLAESNERILKRRGYGQKSPEEVAQQYIDMLLNTYKSECNLDNKSLEKVVITVPEAWKYEDRYGARASIKKIFTSLNIPYKILSEPVAAAIYFAHRFEIKEQYPFNGHVLVCDYGGGTLDLSLSHIQGTEVAVLGGTGTSRVTETVDLSLPGLQEQNVKLLGGTVTETLGKAGVAYDEAVVRRLLKNHHIEVDTRLFNLLLIEFEKKKIDFMEDVSKRVLNYLKDHSIDRSVFNIGYYDNLTVKASDMFAVFNELIAPVLQQALLDMQTKLESNKVNTADGKQFRVVMVGGFSSFCLVRQMVKDFFESKTVADTRFVTHMDLSDTALAISKGAALYANGKFVVEERCPVNIGVYAYNQYNKRIYVPILREGVKLSEYENPQYTTKWLKVANQEALNNMPLTIGYDIGQGKQQEVKTHGLLHQLLPNASLESKWQVGFSVDGDSFFTLHIKDDQGKCNSISLVELSEHLCGLQSEED